MKYSYEFCQDVERHVLFTWQPGMKPWMVDRILHIVHPENSDSLALTENKTFPIGMIGPPDLNDERTLNLTKKLVEIGKIT